MSAFLSIFRPGLFSGQTALVTGGGTGIGLAVTRELASLGARVAIASRKRERLDEACRELRSDGLEVFATTCDIREPDQITRMVDEVLAELGTIDVLVNNAGGQFPSPARAMSPRGWEAVIRNNLNGTFFVTLEVANRVMLPRKRGRIVNVTATVGRGFPGMAHTGAARAGVENLTRSLAIEWVSDGVHINAVAPGNNIRSSGTDRYPQELVELARQATPVKRLGTPEEVSRLIAFLASDANDFITGSVFSIDGGQSLWGDVWQVVEPDPAPSNAKP